MSSSTITPTPDIFTTLGDSPEFFKMLFEDAPDAFYINDLAGIFLAGNKAAEELVGWKREELIGKSMLEAGILVTSEIPKVAAILAQNVLGLATGPAEYTLQRKDGSVVYVEVRNYPAMVNGKRIVLGIARDITHRKQLEENLRKRNEELEAMNKLMVDRELKMVEMKKELEALRALQNTSKT